LQQTINLIVILPCLDSIWETKWTNSVSSSCWNCFLGDTKGMVEVDDVDVDAMRDLVTLGDMRGAVDEVHVDVAAAVVARVTLTLAVADAS
jgi:hypothetical protein